MDWHTESRPQVLARLEVDETGLTEEEAHARLAEHGPNRLPEHAPPSFAWVFLRQFKSPLIYVLAAAGAVSLAIGEGTDAAFIFAVLALNAVIGSVQEHRAEQASRALQQLLKTRATVERDGEAREIDAEEVVPGDVAWLEPGGRVPADMRLLSAQGLMVDESALTGESLAVLKDPAWHGPAEASVGDRLDMAHAGTVAVRGRGRGVVVATGVHTVLGQVAADVTAGPAGQPPLLVRMARFTRVIALAVLGAAVVVMAVGIFVQAQSVSEMFLFAVALAVSAIPEGLPVALTVALAVAASRMARRKVVVRKLAAVEGLGSCDLIATDKTGTLTCNELTARMVELADRTAFRVTGEGYAPNGEVLHDERPVLPGTHPGVDRLARAAVLCSEATLHARDDGWTWRGDPTEVALLSFAHKLGWAREKALANYPELATIPFEPERKYAATFHRLDGEVGVFVKGAPERVLAMCEHPGGEDERRAHEARAEELAAQGYRVLAFAEGESDEEVAGQDTPPEPARLRLVGFVGMIDPLRPGVRDAVAACRRAGVRVIMVTGDHPVTALAIAKDLGMAQLPEEVVTGEALAARTPAEASALVDRIRVFARVAPDQKLAIVEAARERGHFVAVTGDGVNDAPALRAANIGVAMGKSGTDVAREAASLVVSDDNFATLVAGIEEGRVAYDNVRKVIYLLISTGAAEVLLVGLSLAAGTPLPLAPVQLLWLNLVTNGIQDVALAFEPEEPGVLARPPRPPHERIFDRLMIERTLVGAVVMGGVAFGTWSFLLRTGWAEPDARNALLLLMVLFEIVHIGNCRSETVSLFRMPPWRSPILLSGTLVAFGIHVASMYIPAMEAVLGVAPLSLGTWAALGGLTLTITVVMEGHKLLWALRHRGAVPEPAA